MSNHLPTRCDTCGQLDDHPKLHYGEETFHHDTACLPHRVRQDDAIRDHPGIAAITAAADAGVHGQALREHITRVAAATHHTTED